MANAKKKAKKKSAPRKPAKKAAAKKRGNLKKSPAKKKSIAKKTASRRQTSPKAKPVGNKKRPSSASSKRPVRRTLLDSDQTLNLDSVAAEETRYAARNEARTGSAGQSGSLQGLSNSAGADSESVDELVEEGNAFEAGIVAGVENADQSDKEVRTREVLEDDVPTEYLDQD